MDRANEFLRKGDLNSAVNCLLDLSMQVTPYHAAQILCQVSSLIKKINPKKALEFAVNATNVEQHFAFPWINLATMYFEAKMIPKSREAALKALETRIRAVELVEVGRHLSQIGGADQKSLEAVIKGYKLSKESILLASYTLRVALQNADWDLSEKIIAQLRQGHAEGKTKEIGETPRTHLLWCGDEATNIKVISAFAERSYPLREALYQAKPEPATNRKLRVGYISADFREHPTSLLALGLMRFHNRDRFEFYGYCNSYDDGSVLRREMLNRFNQAKKVSHLDDKSVAQMIIADKIDVLIDLNGLTEGSRHGVFAWRAAPVQISYLGFPGTSGGRFVDYIVGDDYTIPMGMEVHYPEKVIRIPPTYQINDYQSRFLPPPCRRESTGLPVNKLVIGMFNNINKVRPDVWNTWLKILNLVPESILWMLDPGEVAQKVLTRRATDTGIQGDRIKFAPKMKQEAHIARLQHCDLVLDPWPYNGHTTTGDALFAGVPVVALLGTNFASRVSGGLLRAAGLGNLVKPTVEAYIEQAVKLLKQPDDLKKIKIYLRQSRMRLPAFDAKFRTLQLESAYLMAYDRAVKGLPPDHITVNAKPQSKPAPKKDDAPIGTERIVS
jgi:hypothetical protein